MTVTAVVTPTDPAQPGAEGRVRQAGSRVTLISGVLPAVAPGSCDSPRAPLNASRAVPPCLYACVLHVCVTFLASSAAETRSSLVPPVSRNVFYPHR